MVTIRYYEYTNLKILNEIQYWDKKYIEKVCECINLEKAIKYLENKGLSKKNLYDYCNYIFLAQQLKFDLSNKSVLYPNDFKKEYDRLSIEIAKVNNPIINKQISSLAHFLSFNKYEDSKYIIYPAPSVESIIDESSMQNNCVRSYCDKYANNETQIYFMRKKSDINKSFVTIEVNNGKIKQAMLKFNKIPGKEILDILNEWENNLINIINE